MQFKERLKELRSKLGLSQAALSGSLDIPKRTIENWEAGSRIPASWVQNLLLNELERMEKNMKISYDYEDLIKELKEEFEDGGSPSDALQILRGGEITGGYKPVTDWYYDDRFMNEYLLEAPEEDQKRYHSDKPNLEQITLHELLEELENKNKIL